ncbi:MAG: thioredoxin [Actinomyces sp.]|nr:MAG: thioredoxin [Actinomyces sp.]
MTAETRPPLPDGLVAVVKRDCPTCVLIAPVLETLAAAGELTVYTQDDPAFPAEADWVRDDTDLAVSWHHDIETVPTLLRVVDGVETERLVGWSRPAWEAFCGTAPLGEDLPEHRPGCGSLSVDPGRVDELRARYGGTGLRSRRIEIARLEDEWEAAYDRGWSDGLPVVPPTETRVLRMLEGTSRSPDEIVAVVPPDLVECTVEKVAINAVMAGCRPEYLPVVLAAVEAVCTDEFNMHGLLATTMGVGPVIVVNGPIRHRIGMNAGINVLGQGNRANSTIGRALQLVVRNVGGGRPGGVDRATQGQPGKIGLCFPEDEEGSPWEPLSVWRGMEPGVSTVTVFAGEAPRIIVDQLSRTPESLVAHFAEALRSVVSPRLIQGFDALLVLSPEHMARFRDAGWSRQDFLAALTEASMIDTDTIVRGAGGIAEGVPEGLAGLRLPKFREGGLLVVHAGGGAGLFSSVIGGWVNGATGSDPVTREIRP